NASPTHRPSMRARTAIWMPLSCGTKPRPSSRLPPQPIARSAAKMAPVIRAWLRRLSIARRLAVPRRSCRSPIAPLALCVRPGCGKAMGSTIDGAPPGSRPYPIEWRDLAAATPADAIRELLLPAPWLFGSLILAAQELYPLALTASFVFFLTGLRVVHGAFHYSLGLPRRVTDFVMFGFSLAMLGSMHAVQWNHLRHHRHCLAEDR